MQSQAEGGIDGGIGVAGPAVSPRKPRVRVRKAARSDMGHLKGRKTGWIQAPLST